MKLYDAIWPVNDPQIAFLIWIPSPFEFYYTVLEKKKVFQFLLKMLLFMTQWCNAI